MSGFNFSHKPKQVQKVSSKYRRIKTEIPVPEDLEILKKAYMYESRSMLGQIPIVLYRA